MARNRQRAKQRQAERRAQRLQPRTGGDGGRRSAAPSEAQSADTEEAQFELEAAAPPEELGRSDMVLEPAPDQPELEEGESVEEEEDEEEYDFEDEEQPYEPAATAPAGKGHATPAQLAGRERHRERGRVLTFLQNVWAELQRVQWPNRSQVLTLTGVVLGFVLIAGGYLGLLDAIFSRVVEAIL
jgi:preprotein translocase SecE subunit